MGKYMKRNVYDQMLRWKQRPEHTTLEVSGARQTGKTYIVNKFADEQYNKKIYINLLEFTGELFLEKYEELRNDIKNGFVCENPVYELIRRTSPDFDDSPDTIVIIDEIQESAAIYNRIREFTRRLKSDFIITGSYLGLTSYFLTHIGCPESAVSGIANENFVFLDLKQRIIPPAGIALETPAFATMGNCLCQRKYPWRGKGSGVYHSSLWNREV